jgi:hypothetical protein
MLWRAWVLRKIARLVRENPHCAQLVLTLGRELRGIGVATKMSGKLRIAGHEPEFI